jgi:hypothetical protein
LFTALTLNADPQFFLKNGVPTWKGFGYAYTRWRPGFGLVISFLVFLTAGMHYVVQHLNHRRDTARVEYFTTAALKVARGAAGRRKVRVPMSEVAGSESLELVVDDGAVYLPHEDGSLTSLDELAPMPSVSRTWPVALVRSLAVRVTGKKEVVEEEVEEVEEVDGYDVASAKPRSRAQQLREERLKGKSSRETTPGTATGTEDESEDTGTGTDTATADGKARRRGPGKANAARRRKMMKK